jgi:hypothetical protein
MSELIKVPTFTFRQGDIFGGGERPVQVNFYEGGELIEITQEGNYDDDEKILIKLEFLDKLVKEIKKHLKSLS